MKQAGLVILAGFILVLVFGGREIDTGAATLAIVAVVAVFGLLCALIAFLVHCQSMESQAWAARPLPPAALPQAQHQPMVLVLQQPQAQAAPQMTVGQWRQLMGLQEAGALPGGVVEGESRELFYPRGDG